MHLSCSYHNIQLVLKDISGEDSYFLDLEQIMKIIPAQISLIKKAKIDELGIGFYRPIQSERCNSMTLNYVTPHLNGICKLFGPEEIK